MRQKVIKYLQHMDRVSTANTQNRQIKGTLGQTPSGTQRSSCLSLRVFCFSIFTNVKYWIKNKNVWRHDYIYCAFANTVKTEKSNIRYITLQKIDTKCNHAKNNKKYTLTYNIRKPACTHTHSSRKDKQFQNNDTQTRVQSRMWTSLTI